MLAESGRQARRRAARGDRDQRRAGASDRASKGVYQDQGIPALQEWFGQALTSAWTVITRLIPDEQPVIEATLKELADQERCHLVLTTGGTGPAPRDR